MQNLGPHLKFNELESALLQDPQMVCMQICILLSSARTSPEFQKHSSSLQPISGGIQTSEVLWPLEEGVPGWLAHTWGKGGPQTMWTESSGIKSVKGALLRRTGNE